MNTHKITRSVTSLATVLVSLVGPMVVQTPAGATGQITTIVATPKPGTQIATVYIPRLRNRVWGRKIVEDTSAKQLAVGFGHYRGTAMPGQVGNFAIAAHRRGPMSPLYDIDHLRTGDKVIIHRYGKWYIYKLTRTMIVKPSAIWVIYPQPRTVVPAGGTPRPIITLQTCTPATTSTHRWIWWGVLSKVTTGTQVPRT